MYHHQRQPDLDSILGGTSFRLLGFTASFIPWRAITAGRALPVFFVEAGSVYVEMILIAFENLEKAE